MLEEKIEAGLSFDCARKANVLVVESRFYPDLSDALLEGAVSTLKEFDAIWNVVRVFGALEIAPAIVCATERVNSEKYYDAFIALGVVIRGETYHFEIVAHESARALMDLSLQKSLAIGQGIVTTENKDQAWARVSKTQGNKGGAAARAALGLVALKRKFEEKAW